jgi:hypothetical protein
MFTDTKTAFVTATGKRDAFHGELEALKSSFEAILWLHVSKSYDRWCALVKYKDGSYGYIRCSYENFWSYNNRVRFYVSMTPTELIQHAMKDHVYKVFRRRVISS